MKNVILPLTLLTLAALRLSAADLRETQYPAEVPKTVVVGGGSYPSASCLKPWLAANPSDYAGKYVSVTITDGHADLDIRIHEEKSSADDVRWHVDGILETKPIVGVSQAVSFKNTELREPKQPCFEVIDPVSGLFVIFVDPDSNDKTPKHAVVIGDQVFVLEKELKPGS